MRENTNIAAVLLLAAAGPAAVEITAVAGIEAASVHRAVECDCELGRVSEIYLEIY